MRTPWGDANTLRERRLSPGRGTPRDVARRNQRERLFAAMVAVTADKGYPETTVADLVELSGVSSRSFYDLFDDKEDCFLATMEEILGNVKQLSEQAQAAPGPPAPPQAVELFVAMAAAQPAAAKLTMVSAFCAGQAPRERIVQAVTELSALQQGAYERLTDRGGMPVELTQAILGGVAVVLYRRLAEGRTDELGQLGAGLREWVQGIAPPPRPLRPRARRSHNPPPAGPPSPSAYVPAERVLRAFAAVVAEKGYAATTIADVAARARISQATFYRHFRDKAGAFESLLDSSGAQMVAAVVPAIRRAPEWPGTVRVALEAICAFMNAERDFARVQEVEAYAVGPEAVAQRDRSREAIVASLASVAEAEGALGGFDAVAVEATLGAFQSLLYSRIQGGRWRDLVEVPPITTYLAFAPALGPEEAWEVACG
jgi:AcrR family transcriptional regulator